MNCASRSRRSVPRTAPARSPRSAKNSTPGRRGSRAHAFASDTPSRPPAPQSGQFHERLCQEVWTHVAVFRSIARNDHRRYTVTHDDGNTTHRATALVDRGVGSADVAGPPVLRAAERDSGRGSLRSLRRGAVRPVLRAGDGATESDAGALFPPLAGRVLRRHRLGTGHRLAHGRFAGGAQFPGLGARRPGPGSLDDLADAALDRYRDPSCRLHLGTGALGGGPPVALSLI